MASNRPDTTAASAQAQAFFQLIEGFYGRDAFNRIIDDYRDGASDFATPRDQLVSKKSDRQINLRAHCDFARQMDLFRVRVSQ